MRRAGTFGSNFRFCLRTRQKPMLDLNAGLDPSREDFAAPSGPASELVVDHQPAGIEG
jgi:hypothetical protein